MTVPPRNTSRAPMEEDAAPRLAVLGRAPELVGVDPWFNAPDGEPLRLEALRDRVVLLDFWTERSVQNARRSVSGTTVVLKLPFARCSPKPSARRRDKSSRVTKFDGF